MVERKVNTTKSKAHFGQKYLFPPTLNVPIPRQDAADVARHVAPTIGAFYELMTAKVLHGYKGQTDMTQDICPDVHVKRGEEPTLVEVKAGQKWRYHKCDTAQLKNYEKSGYRVEYAFVGYGARGETVSSMVNTWADLFLYMSSTIDRIIVVDISIIFQGLKSGCFLRRLYDSWAKDYGRGGFDSVYVNQPFQRAIMEGGDWAGMIKMKNPEKYECKQRKVGGLVMDVEGAKFKVKPFTLFEVVLPDGDTPF